MRQLRYKAEWYGRNVVPIEINGIQVLNAVIAVITLSIHCRYMCVRGRVLSVSICLC